YIRPLKNRHNVQRGEFVDFIAVNYYARSEISAMADGVKEDGYKNDLGWEIYPKGIVEVAKEAYDILHKPIWITENGTCDNAGIFRHRYIAEHLEEISKSDLPIERYYHWCFTDNFEWLEGMSAKFGLVKVDPVTMERTPKISFDFYKMLIEKHGVDKDVYNMYIKNQHYLKKKIDFGTDNGTAKQ
ncbi:MAG: glycoside hydrolase family 1 protein, partial [Firmicutes bacterium]|nr:glycoside hydrolase family 1 protein [Bacillota bacterium]